MTTEEELAESIDLTSASGPTTAALLIAFTLMVVYPYSSRNLGLYWTTRRSNAQNAPPTTPPLWIRITAATACSGAFIRLKDKNRRGNGQEEVLATVSPDNARSLQIWSPAALRSPDAKMYGDFDRLYF